ncbi:MAG: hypothetical protein RLZZ490_1158, partial [Cyanobacteriota bacterium]
LSLKKFDFCLFNRLYFTVSIDITLNGLRQSGDRGVWFSGIIQPISITVVNQISHPRTLRQTRIKIAALDFPPCCEPKPNQTKP